ncbi:hypothetical protein AVEN_273136-1 [Araneus ventricosus]|uniref:Endonuclease/exonuclease/phosphatase domain-containing protein n=1 Tax=Araneus ventricosus TaxID=182803 RepID=A0A4Y2K8Q3_ARAVE|nr:hypothetical protein AVEN_273136-1 [Araneus ventricosus]
MDITDNFLFQYQHQSRSLPPSQIISHSQNENLNTSQFSLLNSTNSPWSCSSSSPDPLRILQIYLGKGKVATANLPKEAKTHKIDLILVQEPYSKGAKILGIPKSWNQWLSENGKAGKISLPSANTPIFLGIKENAVAIKIQTSIGPLSIISGYSSPYSDIQNTIQDISQFITSLTQESVLIGAYMNAHSTLWGYPNDSLRGNAMEDFISSTNLHLLNVKDGGPTFQQRNAKGWPDLPLSIG